MDNCKECTCCFIGHRKIDKTKELKEELLKIVEELILTKKVNTFLFGSRSEFDDFCYEIVTELKNKYQNVKRVYVRAEYPFININYENYLLKKYEETYYPEKILGAGKASYV